jgi:hypothetical protein
MSKLITISFLALGLLPTIQANSFQNTPIYSTQLPSSNFNIAYSSNNINKPIYSSQNNGNYNPIQTDIT